MSANESIEKKTLYIYSQPLLSVSFNFVAAEGPPCLASSSSIAVTGGLVARGDGANVPLKPDVIECGGDVAPPLMPIPTLEGGPNPGGVNAVATGETSGIGTAETPAVVGVAFAERAIGGAPELNSAHFGHFRFVSVKSLIHLPQ